MKLSFSTQNWSERRQVLAIMLMGGVVIAVLSYCILLPLSRSKKILELRNREMAAQLSKWNYGADENTLVSRKSDEERIGRTLAAQFSELMNRLAAFPDPAGEDGAEVRSIDFKVALLETRKRVCATARVARVDIPADLGMKDFVRGNEEPGELMCQLRAVEKVCSIAVDLGISAVNSVEPLKPRNYFTGGTNDVYMREYPVSISFRGDSASLYALFRSMLSDGTVCALRRVRLEKPLPGRMDVLEVSAVISVFVFPKTLAELGRPDRPEAPMNPSGA